MNYTKFPKYYNSTNGDKQIEKIPMKDLFDMMSGTSTGSILSAGLSVREGPSRPNYPKYWAMDAVKIYIDGGPIIFQQNKVGKSVKVLCYIFSIIVCGLLFFYCGLRKYDSKKYKKSLNSILESLIQHKELLLEKEKKMNDNEIKNEVEEQFQNIEENDLNKSEESKL